MSAIEHAARGTYRPGVHGPLPPGIVPAPRRTALLPTPPASAPLASVVTQPARPGAALDESDCPDVLTPEGQAIWKLLITQRPTEKVLAPFVMMYVEAMLAWKRATREIQSKGDYGTLGKKLLANPYLKSRREAEATMFRVAQLLGWQGPNPSAVPMPAPATESPRSRLELFLAARESH